MHFNVEPVFYPMKCSTAQNPLAPGKGDFSSPPYACIQMYYALHGASYFPLTSSQQSLCALKHEIKLPISLSWPA
jgi:hypothetical protein